MPAIAAAVEEEEHEHLQLYQLTFYYWNELIHFEEAFLQWVSEQYKQEQMLFEQQQQQRHEAALILNMNFQQQDQEMMEQDNLPEVHEVEHVDDENNNAIVNNGEEDYNNIIIHQGDDKDNNVDIIENIIIMDQNEGEKNLLLLIK